MKMRSQKLGGLLFDKNYLKMVPDCKIYLLNSPLQNYSLVALLKAVTFEHFSKTMIKNFNKDLIELKNYYEEINNYEALESFKNKNNVCASLITSSYVGYVGDNVLIIEPDEGAPMIMDVMVISQKSQNVDEAHKFIDFMLRPEIAAQNAKNTRGMIPVNGIKDLLDDKYTNNHLMFPSDKSLNHMFMLRSINDTDKTVLKNGWDEFKKSN